MSCINRPGIEYADDQCDVSGEDFKVVTQRAGRNYKCNDCGFTIRRRDRYERASCHEEADHWDDSLGELHVWRRCMDCVALQEMIANEMNICVPYGGLEGYLDGADLKKHPWADFQAHCARIRGRQVAPPSILGKAYVVSAVGILAGVSCIQWAARPSNAKYLVWIDSIRGLYVGTTYAAMRARRATVAELAEHRDRRPYRGDRE